MADHFRFCDFALFSGIRLNWVLTAPDRVPWGGTHIDLITSLVPVTRTVGFNTSQDGVTVYVSETLSNLRRAMMRDVLRRVVGIAFLGIVATLVVNLVLWRVVARPIKQLVATVQEIADGKLGIQSTALPSVELNYLAGEINAMSKSLAAASRSANWRRVARVSS